MKAKADYPNINPAEPQGLKPDGKPFGVLIVDDSMFIAKQVSQILSSSGFRIVATASNGQEALKQYQSHKDSIDLVTMDITMPGMDGLTALEHLIKMDPDAKVIMISAVGKDDLVKKALLTGAKNYIIKPLDRKKVLERVVQTLKQ